VITDFSPEAGGAALNRLLALPDPPTAVFVGSDTQAIGVLEAARQGGYRVPDDLSVLGYNDIEVAQYLGLSTLRVPMRAMGQQGVQLLLATLAGSSAAPAHICLPAEVVVRLTTGPVP
jgi:DNA-binding LacI/PurR family transcriptional regulator